MHSSGGRILKENACNWIDDGRMPNNFDLDSDDGFLPTDLGIWMAYESHSDVHDNVWNPSTNHRHTNSHGHTLDHQEGSSGPYSHCVMKAAGSVTPRDVHSYQPQSSPSVQQMQAVSLPHPHAEHELPEMPHPAHNDSQLNQAATSPVVTVTSCDSQSPFSTSTSQFVPPKHQGQAWPMQTSRFASPQGSTQFQPEPVSTQQLADLLQSSPQFQPEPVSTQQLADLLQSSPQTPCHVPPIQSRYPSSDELMGMLPSRPQPRTAHQSPTTSLPAYLDSFGGCTSEEQQPMYSTPVELDGSGRMTNPANVTHMPNSRKRTACGSSKSCSNAFFITRNLEQIGSEGIPPLAMDRAAMGSRRFHSCPSLSDSRQSTSRLSPRGQMSGSFMPPMAENPAHCDVRSRSMGHHRDNDIAPSNTLHHRHNFSGSRERISEQDFLDEDDMQGNILDALSEEVVATVLGNKELASKLNTEVNVSKSVQQDLAALSKELELAMMQQNALKEQLQRLSIRNKALGSMRSSQSQTNIHGGMGHMRSSQSQTNIHGGMGHQQFDPNALC